MKTKVYGMICAAVIACATSHTLASVDLLSSEASRVIDTDAQLSVHGEGYQWSEGPVWVSEHGFLLFSDVPANTIYQLVDGQSPSIYLTPSGSTDALTAASSQGSNGLLIDASGRLILMQHGDRRVALLDADLMSASATFVTLADRYQGKRLNSPNDGILHSDGSLYFTDPPYGLSDPATQRELDFDGIYRLTPDGELTLLDRSIRYPNGIVFIDDEQALLVAASDRDAARWYKFDVTPDGGIANKQVFFDATDLVGQPDMPGLPDGMVTHSSGLVFATGPGGVFLFNPTGELLAKIKTGKATANVTLSADESRLYITAHDQLMSLPLVQGAD